MTSAINTKLGTHIVYGSLSACIDPEIEKSKVKVTWWWKPSRSNSCCGCVLLPPVWNCTSMTA